MNRKFSIVVTVFVVGVIMASGCGSTLRASKSLSEPLAGGDWLDGWLYRKAHNITGSVAGPQVNYPVMLNVRFPSGSDDDGIVFLAGHCRGDFGDVRFTDADGHGLNYWMQQRADNVQALFWVTVGFIPPYPGNATIYVYYGNPNASTTSNKYWTFDYIADFEDGTNGTWSVSWSTHPWGDGVADEQVFQGNFCRWAGRIYGSSGAGRGDIYDQFQDFSGVYLASGSYWLQGAARFEIEDAYVVPQGISLQCDSASVAGIAAPHTSWHLLEGNLTIAEGHWISLAVEFHLFVTSGASYVGEYYSIDSLVLRKWCSPEPAHGAWSTVEVWSQDVASPSIVSVAWMPAAPFPFVPSSTPRSGEMVAVWANVTDSGGSGLDVVQLSYRADAGPWCNVSMAWNATSGLWDAAIPGYPGNCSVEFFVTGQDGAGNLAVSAMQGYVVRSLPVGDVDGDGDVDIYDLVKIAGHYGDRW